MKKVFAYLFLFIGLSVSAGVPFAFAQSTPQPAAPQTLQVQGLAINPFLIDTDVTAGKSNEYEISLSNTTDLPLTFETSINDFTTNGQNGQPLFLPTSQHSDPKYSLSSWIKITQQPQFTIPPGGTTSIHFTITPPADAENGTHYGGLLFGQPATTPEGGSTAVQSKVGTIILARLGKDNSQGTISQFNSDRRLYRNLPVNFSLTFNNYGNVHSKPKGDIYIRNIFGQEVADIQVNRDANIVLPETQRQFVLSWKPRLAFGRYTAEAVMYFGNPKLETRSTTAFWVIPVLPLIEGIAGIILLGLALYVIIKRYNRYIIKRSQK